MRVRERVEDRHPIEVGHIGLFKTFLLDERDEGDGAAQTLNVGTLLQLPELALED